MNQFNALSNPRQGASSTVLLNNKILGHKDHQHMNAAYGALVLEQLLAELGIAVERVSDPETPAAVAHG